MTVTRKTETSAERSSRRVGAIAMVCAAVVMALGLAGPVARAQDLGHDPGSAETGSMASGADMGADMGPDTGSDMGAVGTSRLDAPDDGMSDMGPSDSGASGAAQDDGVVGLIQAPDGVPGLPADLLPPPLRPMDMDAANIASFAEVQARRMPGPIDHPPVVVELFTAQGCSSCPPADDMLADLSDRSDVLALSWHVDYWDYLGWADDFARPEFTRRQYAYAHETGERAIYTPQMIVGGTDTLIALRPAELMGLVQMQMARPPLVMVSSSQQPGGYRIELTPRGPVRDRVAIILVRYAPHRKVVIKAGENRGVALDYRNVVLAAERIAEWDGRTPLRMTVTPDPKSGDAYPADTRHVILAQELGSGDKRAASGPILAAIRLD